MIKTSYLSILLGAMGLLLLQNCIGSNSVALPKGKEVKLKYASNLKMEEFDGFIFAEIRNPWDTTRIMSRLILLDKDVKRPTGFDDAVVVTVPLNRSVVYSSVYNSLISELGRSSAIVGICDREYIVDEEVNNGIASGKIQDCGNSMAPNMERILQLSPDAVLLSPYENGGREAKFELMGIPVVECADYMESSPLGRAEWMKFYGRLYGVGNRADSLFNVTEKEYQNLKEIAANAGSKPSVIFDRIYGQSWSVPAGNSTVGILINDAGGCNPFAHYPTTGSVQLSPEKVMQEGGDANLWIIRYAKTPLNMRNLKDEKPIYGMFKAYKDGNVFGSETIQTNIFDDMAFHPHWVLQDMIRIIHPEVEIKDGKRYFEKLENEN